MAKKYTQQPNRPQQPHKPVQNRPVSKNIAEGEVSVGTAWEPAGWLVPALIALAITAVVYLPSIGNDYVNWDDDPNITENKNLQHIDWQSIKDIFDLDKGNVIGNYNPLPILTFAIEKMILGKFSPTFTHLLNWLLHLGTVFFVIRFLLHLGIGRWGAFIGGLLFGIHPMRVESVAWATERKDVLFGIFFFATLMYYVRWVKTEAENRRAATYILMVVLALLSHLSKVQAVSLVLSMYVVDYWLQRQWTLQNFVIEKLPFGIMALLTGMANLYTLDQVGSTTDNVTNFTSLDRFLIGSYQFCTYLYKLLIPYPLSPLYPYDRDLPAMANFAPIGFLGVIGLGLWLYFKNRRRELVFGLAFFFFNVMFLLQWKPAGQGYLADRFTYVPYFGFFFLAAWWYEKIIRDNPAQKGLLNGIFGVFFFMCAVVSYKQIKIWQNGETLWTHVIGFEGKSISLAWGNRAHYFRGKGDFEKSLKDYTQAIQIAPDRNDHYNSRGKTYFDMAMSGKYKSQTRELAEKSIADYTKGLSVEGVSDKNKAEMLANRGAATASLGNYAQAEKDLTDAIALDPQAKNAYLNRSLVYYSTNQFQKAIADHSKILEIEPYNANIWYERGLCKNALRDFPGAIEDMSQCIKLDPNIKFAYFERARAYAQSSQRDKAMLDIQQAQKMGMKITQQDMTAIGL